MNDFMRLKESSLVGQEVPTSANDKVSYHFFVCLEGEMCGVWHVPVVFGLTLEIRQLIPQRYSLSYTVLLLLRYKIEGDL